MSILSIDLHISKSTIRMSFHFKTSLMNHLTTSIVESSVPGVTPTCLDDGLISTLRLIPPVRRRMSCCDSCYHSRCNAASNWRMLCTGGSRTCIRRSNMSQICSGIQIRAHGWPRNRSHGFTLEVGGYCSWTMRPGVVIHIHRLCS